MANFKIGIEVDEQGAIKDIAKVEKELKKLAKTAKGAGNDGKTAFTPMTKAIKGFGKSILGPIAAVATLTTAISVMTKVASSSIKTFASFEKSMSNVKALLNPTSEEFDDLTKKAKTLGATTAFTAQQSAQAFSELGKLGFSTTDILASTDAVLSLASATGSDLTIAANAAAKTLNQFGLEAEDAGRVADVIALSSSSSAVDIYSFGEAMKYAGGVANGFNVSLEETTAAISVMSNAGLEGTLAGTGLSKMLVEMGDESSKAYALLKELGVENGTLTEKLLALNSAGLSTNKIMDIFGQIAGKSAIASIKNAKDVDTLTKSYKKAGGAAKKMADTQLDNLAGSFTLMKSALDGVKLTLGKELNPEMSKLTASLTSMFTSLENSGLLKELALSFNLVLEPLNLLVETMEAWTWMLAGQAKSDEAIKAWDDIFNVQKKMNGEVEQYKKKLDEIDSAVEKGWITEEQALKGKTNYQEYIARQLEKESETMSDLYKITGATNTSLKYKTILLEKIGITSEKIEKTNDDDKKTTKNKTDEISKQNDLYEKQLKFLELRNKVVDSFISSTDKGIDLGVSLMPDGMDKEIAKFKIKMVRLGIDIDKSISEMKLNAGEMIDVLDPTELAKFSDAYSTAMDSLKYAFNSLEQRTTEGIQAIRDKYKEVVDEIKAQPSFFEAMFGVEFTDGTWGEKFITMYDSISSFAQSSMDVIGQIANYAVTKDQQRLDSWKETQQGMLDSETMSDRRRKAEQKKLDKEEEKRQKEIAKKQAKMQVANLWMNTLASIPGIWGGYASAFAPMGYAAPALIAAFGGATTAMVLGSAGVQTASILAQANFANSGFVGATGGKDNQMVNAREGELFLNGRDQQDLLEGIRGGGLGGTTVQIENFSGNDDDISRLEDMLYRLQSNGRISDVVFG